MTRMPRMMFTQIDDPEESSPPPMEPVVCAMELLASAQLMQDVHEFAPFVLVKEKPSMSMFERTPPCLLFIRYLDRALAEDQAIIQQTHKERLVSRVDCIVAFREPNGNLLFVPHDAMRLTPYDGPRSVE